MANPANGHGFIAEFCIGGNAIPMYQGVLKSAQSCTKGDALKATGGLLKIFTVGGRKVVGVAAETVTGLATAQSRVLFWPAVQTVVFSGQYSSNTGVQLTQGLAFSRRNISGATGKMLLTSGTLASTGIAQIIGISPKSAAGTYGEAEFIWIRSQFTGQAVYTLSGY